MIHSLGSGGVSFFFLPVSLSVLSVQALLHVNLSFTVSSSKRKKVENEFSMNQEQGNGEGGYANRLLRKVFPARWVKDPVGERIAG